MPPEVASCVSGGVQGETGWLTARPVTEEVEGSASKDLGRVPGRGLFFQQRGFSFPSSPADIVDQLLGLGSLAKIAAQVTPNPRILWFHVLPRHECLLQSVGVSYRHAQLSLCLKESHCRPAGPLGDVQVGLASGLM